MFEIRMGDTCVGHAQVRKNGLYYHVNCVCDPPSKQIHRIIMRNNTAIKDLGICVPDGMQFALFARVPVKQFQGESFIFELIDSAKGDYAVSSNMPFAHLDELETARLSVANGQRVILIDPAPDQQGSGLNQEYLNR